MEKRIRIYHWLVLAGLAALTVVLERPPSGDGDQHEFLNPPPEHIEYFHFGFNESMADSLWLRWIQDSDSCQTYLKPVQKLDTVLGDDPLTRNPRHKICDNSWGFKMLDAVTKLAPHFWMPYVAGAITLSVIVEDYEGASILFERGLKMFPDDWMITYRAAYHFLYDRQDVKRAAELLNHAGDIGAPTWVKSLASRLYQKSGQIELGIATLESYKATLTDEKAIAEVNKRIENLRSLTK